MGAEAGRSLWQALLTGETLGPSPAFRPHPQSLQYFPSAPRVKSKPLIHTDPAPGKASVQSI